MGTSRSIAVIKIAVIRPMILKNHNDGTLPNWTYLLVSIILIFLYYISFNAAYVHDTEFSPDIKEQDSMEFLNSRAFTSYIVQANDTISSIAFRYGIKLDLLMKQNTISDPKDLKIGEKLCIPLNKNIISSEDL